MSINLHLLLEDFPHLNTDSIQFLLYIYTHGPLVPISDLCERLNWNKVRAAKALAGITGRVDKRWFEPNKDASPILVREDINVSDLRAKNLSLTPLAKSYFEQPVPVGPGKASLFEDIRKMVDSVVERQYGLSSFASILFSGQRDTLKVRCQLVVNYIELKSTTLRLDDDASVSALLQWLTFDALEAEAKTTSPSGHAAANILDSIYSEDETTKINPDVVYQRLGFIKAIISHCFNELLGSRPSGDEKFERQINVMLDENCRNAAQSILKFWKLHKSVYVPSEMLFGTKGFESAITWQLIRDTFKSRSLIDVDNLTVEQLSALADGQFPLGYIMPDALEAIKSLAKEYIWSMSGGDTGYWHRHSLSLEEKAKILESAKPNIQCELVSIFTAINQTGFSAVIDSNSDRIMKWVAHLSRKISNKSKTYIINDVLDTNLRDLHSIAKAGVESLLIICVVDSSVNQKSLQHAMNIYSLLTSVYPKLKVHLHSVFHKPPFPASLFSLDEFTYQAHSICEFWSKVNAISLGRIDKDESRVVFDWLLESASLPPVDVDDLQLMPQHRLITLDDGHWEIIDL